MRLTICGDVSPSYCDDLFQKGDIDALFGDVPEAFKDSDRVIINLECALTNSDYKIEKGTGPNLKASPVCADVLKNIGVTDCAISNNHIFDYGTEGVLDTLSAIGQAGMNYTGFGDNYEDSRRDLIIEQDGKKIAIINVCEHEYCYALENRMGARPFDPYDTIEDIRRAKDSNDFVIVIYHGGKEQCVYPSPRLRKACRAMVWHGADVVLCQHSHCIGCYEEYEGAHILYGQGNFHFVKFITHPHWCSGLIAQLDISDKIDIDFVPIVTNSTGISLAKGEDFDNIMKPFKERSEDLKTGKWYDGWLEFCDTLIPSYQNTVRHAFTDEGGNFTTNLMAFLKCEAHHDVLEEAIKHSWETRTEP